MKEEVKKLSLVGLIACYGNFNSVGLTNVQLEVLNDIGLIENQETFKGRVDNAFEMIKFYVKENSGDWKIDWTDTKQGKYYLGYEHITDTWDFYCAPHIQTKIKLLCLII